MTDLGQRAAALAPIRADGINLARLAEASATQTVARQGNKTQKFWASGQRPIGSDHREVLTVTFGSARLVNHLTFKVSRFPLTLEVEYLDANGDWQAITYARTRGKKRTPRREVRRQPVRLSISESVPARVDSAKATAHPQHFGRGHWREESWKVMPVRTRKIRFVIVRNHRGKAPKNHHGHKVPYSVAIKGLSVGYRVLNRDDIPKRHKGRWWATGKDILGSQTVYSTYRQSAAAAIDGDLDTYWRSEPQPFPFAVVPMYLDLRDGSGEAPVIDRFWLDPITTGVNLNVYYCDTAPEGEFEGVSDPIPLQFRTETSSPGKVLNPSDNLLTALDLGPGAQAGIEVSQAYHRMDYSKPWWVGLDARALVGADDLDPHPIISIGSTQVLQDGATLKVLGQSGAEAVIDLDPARHGVNAEYRLVAAYYPEDPASQRPAHFRITYRLGSNDPVTVEQTTSVLEPLSVPIRIGLHPDPESADVPAVSVKGLVVKSEGLTEDVEAWFLDEGEAFVADPETAYDDRGTAQNARLRMHPQFVAEGNFFGVVGGAGNRYEEMEWTPVMRDYTLKRGYLHVPPTQAAYWKFEMTGLLAEVYENFLSIEREVLVFPPDVVANHQAIAGRLTNAAAPSGVATTGNLASDVAYSDVLETVRTAPPAPADATGALVVRDPVRAQQVAQSGWIWHYQPWHVGSVAPRFLGTRQHRYESLSIQHSTKVAFFAAIREIMPFRVDYSFDDDTPEYVEHLLDTAFIDLDATSGMEFTPGGVRSVSASGQITSVALRSYRTVRGVQFASQETDSVQVLVDPDFSSLDRWTEYGDASLDRLAAGDVVVNRGWFVNTYGDLENQYPTFGDMEGVPYALLEGNNQASGYAEGGIVSETYTPTGAGKITAIAKVSGTEGMDAPVVVEIVSAYDDRVVASETRWVRTGETATIQVGYAPGGLTEKRTYGDLESLVSLPTTYGELEQFKYYELESETGILSDLYVRVRQQGQTDDAFHVHRVGLYDSPIAWFFSNDDGATWWQAIDVRNNPHGVLIFPPPADPEVPEVGRVLRWQARVYREDAVLTGLHIRPWYGTRARTVDRSHGLESIGPNKSIYDDFPATHQHPMWVQTFNPIEITERTSAPDPETVTFWRNLVFNPGNEGEHNSWTATGGTVVVQHTPGEV